MKTLIYTVEVQGTESQVRKLNQVEKELYDITKARNKLIRKQRQGKQLDREEQAELTRLTQKQKELQNARARQNREITRTINSGKANLNTLRAVNAELAIQRQKILDVVIGSKEYHQIAKRIKDLELKQRQFNAEIGKGMTFVGEYSKGFRNAFAKVGMAVAGVMAVYHGFNRLLGGTIDTFKKFEQGQAFIQGMLEKTNQTLQEDTIRLAKEYGIQLEVVNAALYEAVQAGVQSADMIQYLDEASKLAIAGMTDLNVVIDGTTSVMNAYGLSIDELNKLTNALYTGQLYGKITIQEYAEEIGTVVPIARQAGMSYQELIAAIAELTRVGVPVQQTMTGLRAGISSILSPSKEAEEAFARIGIQTGATAIQQQGLMNVIAKITQATKENKDVLSEVIPEMRAFVAVASFTEDNLEEYHEILEKVTNSTGENSQMMQQFRMQMATASKESDRHRAKMEALRVTVGEQLRPTYNRMLDTGGRLLEWVSKHINFVVSLVKALGSLVAVYSAWRLVTMLQNRETKIALFLSQSLEGAKKGLQQAISLLTVKRKAHTVALKAEKVAQEGVNTAAKAFPWNWISAAITGAIMLITSFTSKARAARQAQTEWNESMKAARQPVIDMATELNYLMTVAGDETRTLQEREEAVKKINDLMPEHLGNLDLEAVKSGTAATAIKEHVKAIEEQALVQAKLNRIKEIALELDSIEQGTYESKLSFWQKVRVAMDLSYGVIAKANYLEENTLKTKEALTEEQAKLYRELGISTEVTEENTDVVDEAAKAAQQMATAEANAAEELDRLNKINETQAQKKQRAIQDETKRHEETLKGYMLQYGNTKAYHQLLEQEATLHSNNLLAIDAEYEEKSKAINKKIQEVKLKGQQYDIRTLATISENLWNANIETIDKGIQEELALEVKRWEDIKESYTVGSSEREAALQAHLERMAAIRQAAEQAKAWVTPFEIEEEAPVEDDPEILAFQQTQEFKLELIRQYAAKNKEYALDLANELIGIEEDRLNKEQAIMQAKADMAIAGLSVLESVAKDGSVFQKAVFAAMKAVEIAQIVVKTAASNAAIMVAATAQAAAMPLMAPAIFAKAAVYKMINKIQAGTAIAAILGQTIKEFKAAKGAIVKGRGTPTSDNIPAWVSPGEAIINARSMADNDYLSVTGTPRQIASAINSYKGYGVRFAEGKAPVVSTPSVVVRGETVSKEMIQDIVRETVSGIVNIPVVVSEREITAKRRIVSIVKKEGDF